MTLCSPDVRSEDISVEWVKELLSGIDGKWVVQFCNTRPQNTYRKASLLEYLRAAAEFNSEDKAKLLLAWNSTRHFEEGYQAVSPNSGVFANQVALRALQTTTWRTVRVLFEAFYDPLFYDARGYSLPTETEPTGLKFRKADFLRLFRDANQEVAVCPMCDGTLGDAEVDHFLPKSQFPLLAVHPMNLVPICQTCNGSRRKSQRVPLREGETDPAMEWFHPYLRPANNQYEIEFQRVGNQTNVVLRGVDPTAQKRIDNLSALLGLGERWSEELGNRVQATIRKIRQLMRKRRKEYISEEELKDWLDDWAAMTATGRDAFGILNKSYLHAAAKGNRDLFDELIIAAGGRDVLTGELLCESLDAATSSA